MYGEFVYADGARRHGLLFTIDLAFHGVISGVDVVTAPQHLDRVVGDLDRHARRNGGRFQQVPPAEASDLLRGALVASADETLPPLRTTHNSRRIDVRRVALGRGAGVGDAGRAATRATS